MSFVALNTLLFGCRKCLGCEWSPFATNCLSTRHSLLSGWTVKSMDYEVDEIQPFLHRFSLEIRRNSWKLCKILKSLLSGWIIKWIKFNSFFTDSLYKFVEIPRNYAIY